MNRRAPELALVAGALLAASLGGFALWATGDVSHSLLAGAALLYPFALYAIRHDDDPTGVLPPRAVGVAGVVGGTVLVLDAVVTGRTGLVRTLLREIFFGLLVALPPAAYAVEYGDAVTGPPGRAIVAGAAATGALLAAAGLLAGSAFGAVAGALVGVSGALLAHERGFEPTRDASLAAVGVGVVLGTAVLLAGLLSGRVTPTTVVTAACLALAPGILFALTVESRSFD